MRGLIAVSVAWAVCWHTVAGCCAHHAHAAPAEQESTADTSPAQASLVPPHAGDGSCCHHASAVPVAQPAAGPLGSRELQTPRPSERCDDAACAFAVDAAEPLLQGEQQTSLPPAVAIPSPVAGSQTELSALQPDCGVLLWPFALRSHLALGVLLL